METEPDTASTRRDGVEGCSITLADGNPWLLAMPSTRLRPKVVHGFDALGRPSETIEIATEFGYSLEIRRLIGDLRSASEAGTAERRYDALIRLATALICRSHEIEPEQAVSLLQLDMDELPRLVDAVLSVVAGNELGNASSPRKSDLYG